MDLILSLHSVWRWVVLLGAVLAVAGMATARGGKAPAWAARTGVVFTIAIDIQVLLGLMLWAGEAAWRKNAFVGYIHPVAMLAAVAVAHVGRSRERKALKAGSSPAGALWLYLASLVLIVLFIPFYAWRG